MDKRIKNCIKKQKEIREKIERLHDLEEQGVNCKELLEQAYKELTEYQENVLAKTIFEVCSVKNPKLVKNKTKEVVLWDTVFGDNFFQLSKLEIYDIIGLVESGGKYKIK